MIDKTKIIDTVIKKTEKLPVGHYLDLKTYNRNRTVIIAKIAEDNLLVIENGYFKDRFSIKPPHPLTKPDARNTLLNYRLIKLLK